MRKSILDEEHILSRIVGCLLALLVLALVIVTFLQVFYRYVLARPLHWTDEAARYIFVWLCMLGAAVAVRRNAHVSLDYFALKLPERLRKTAGIVTSMLTCGFLCAVTYFGIGLLAVTRDQLSIAMQIPMSIPYMSVPVGAGLSIVYLLVSVYQETRGVLACRDRNTLEEPRRSE